MVESLTQKEQLWIERAQRLFDSAPDRFAFMTTGNFHFHVLDHEGARRSELCDGAAERDGVVLGTVYTKTPVHGVSG